MEAAECQVQLRKKPVRITERSSVNQCINELSSNLAAEAARRRCNSEIVQRNDIKEENNGNYCINLTFTQFCFWNLYFNSISILLENHLQRLHHFSTHFAYLTISLCAISIVFQLKHWLYYKKVLVVLTLPLHETGGIHHVVGPGPWCTPISKCIQCYCQFLLSLVFLYRWELIN